MRNENEKHELVSEAYYRLKEVTTSQVDVVSKIKEISNILESRAFDAECYGYNKESNMLNDIRTRVERLMKVKKAHKIEDRINSIIEDIKW